MRKLLQTGLAVAFAASLGGAAQAQSADAAIAARKAGMDLLAAASGAAKRTIDAKGEVKPGDGAPPEPAKPDGGKRVDTRA